MSSQNTASEEQPLLSQTPETSTRSETPDSLGDPHTPIRGPKINVARRFVQLFILGIILIVAVQLSFLPRTSPSRDFRRWHKLRLTKTDAKRMFLVQSEIGKPDPDGSTIEKNILSWLQMLEKVNKKHGSAVAASCAPEATDFLVSQIRSMNYDFHLASYPLPGQLRAPKSSCMQLRDISTGRVLYKTDLREPVAPTPAFFVFGANGTVSGQYVYAGHGTPHELQQVQRAGGLSGKIVIISHSPLAADYSLRAKVKYAESFSPAAVLVYDETETHSISRAYRSSSPHSHMPVSFRQIQPILDTLKPPGHLSAWKYGPTPQDESLQLEISHQFSDENLHAVNLLSGVEGVLNDAEIVIGASRDTLTSGNPSSGQAILLELMRRFQYLKLYGWKPLRTIRFAFWDASRSGALGSSACVADPLVFHQNLPVLAYINLDLDVVTGSRFTVDANPLFNHILANTAKSVSFPKKRQWNQNLDGVSDRHQVDESQNHMGDLWQEMHINNKLGNTLETDHGVFQLSKDTPIVSVKFAPGTAPESSPYIPESNYYNLDWLKKYVDPQLELHGSLVRFVGLLTLSLGEHEVVEYKTNDYFSKMLSFFEDFAASNQDTLSKWAHRNVSSSLVGKSLLSDIRANESEIEFGQILNQTRILLTRIVDQASLFDTYSREVENLWTTDYPWYRMIRKIHIFAKFKITNYKMLRLEKEMNQHSDPSQSPSHFMYEPPSEVLSCTEARSRAAFASLYEAADRGDMESLVRRIGRKYEGLSSLARRIS